MKAKKLYLSIIQLAISGKLVPQLDEEPSVTQIGDIPEDPPFEIPEKWKWSLIGTCLQYGKSEQVLPDQIPNNAWILDLEDIEKDTGKLLNKKKGIDVKSNKTSFKKGDVLYGKLRPYLRKCIIADEDGFCTTEIVVVRKRESNYEFDSNFLKIVFLSPYFSNYANSVSYGVKMPRLGTKDANKALIPIPPLSEQRRIVDRLKEILPLIDKYDEYYTKLVTEEKTFPERLKKSILQQAIQGKLVPQLDEEPSVEQIGDVPAEPPFEIPEKWKWIQFKNTCECCDGKRIPIKREDRASLDSIYPYYGATGIIDYVDDYLFDGKYLLIGEDGANLLSKSKNNAFIVTGKFWVNNHAHIFSEEKIALLEYLSFFINSLTLDSYITGTAQPKLTQKSLLSIYCPLPPFSEQRRIVSRLNELFALVDKMTGVEAKE